MRQRLGIAQAMLGSPKLLILDEPANGLDPAGIREIRELLRALAHDQQMAIFVSSHLLGEIELMCDRVAIIHKGQLLREGSVKDLISSRREMEFRVGDVARASAIVQSRGLTFRADTDRLWISMDESEAPPLVAAFAESGVPLFHVQRHVETLEEMFLQATGGETVD
jgi:ABC-2 type transport system ATP-binding protein